jgi:hypothetical protein
MERMEKKGGCASWIVKKRGGLVGEGKNEEGDG